MVVYNESNVDLQITVQSHKGSSTCPPPRPDRTRVKRNLSQDDEERLSDFKKKKILANTRADI